MRKITNLMMAFAVFAAVQGCQKDPGGNNGDGGVGVSCDFKTTDDYQLSINYRFGGQFLVEFYSENPVDPATNLKVEGAEPFFKAATDSWGKISGMSMDMPTWITEVYLYTEQLGVPSLTVASVANRTVTFDIAAVSGTKALSTRTGTHAGFEILAGWDALGVPEGVQQGSIPYGLFSSLEAALPNGKAVSSHHPWFLEAPLNNYIRLSEKTSVKMSFIHNGGTFRNAIGYYYYPRTAGDAPGITKDQVERFVIAFPNASYLNERGGLLSGDYMMLKYWDEAQQQYVDSFPANYAIGFFLVSNGFSATSGNVKGTKDNTYYAHLSLNEFTEDVDLMQRNLALLYHVPGEDRSVVAITFEDRSGAIDSDFNDVMFCVEASGIVEEDMKELNPVEPKPVPDYENVYKGILAFEDRWPWEGDYDLNDMIVKYECTVYHRGTNNTIKQVVDKFWLSAAFAAIPNGFAYQYGVTPGQLASIDNSSAYVPQFNILSPILDPAYNAPLEQDQTKATVLLFENSKLITPANNAFVFTTKFKSNFTLLKDIGTPPYNPFIITNLAVDAQGAPAASATRDYEVHLANYTPTDLANKGLLGSGLDGSKPANGIYYVSKKGNFPWALQIRDANFKCPKEGVRIDVAYPDFNEWVSSGKTRKADWYLNPDLDKVKTY